MDQVLIVFGYIEEEFNSETLFNNLSESLKSLSSDVIAKLNQQSKTVNAVSNPEFGKSIDIDNFSRVLYMPTIEQFRNAFYKILQNSIQDQSPENVETQVSKVTVIYCGQLAGSTSDWILSDSSFNGEQLISWLDGNSAKNWLSILNMIVEKRSESPVQITLVTPECGPKTGWPISKTAGSNFVSDYSTFVGKQRLATKLYIGQSGKILGNPKPDGEDCKNLATILLKNVTKIPKLPKETVPLRNRQDCINENVRSMKSSVPTLYMFPVGDYAMNSGMSLFSVDNINVIINGAHSSIDKAPLCWPLISVMNLIDSVILPDWSSNNIVFQRFLRNIASKNDGTRFGPLLISPSSSNETCSTQWSLNPIVDVSEDDFQMNFASSSPGDVALPKCQLFYCIGAGELFLQPLTLKAGLVLVWKNKKKVVRILYPNNQLIPAGTSPSSCLTRLVKSLSMNTKLLNSLDGETIIQPNKTKPAASTTKRPETAPRSTTSASRPAPSAAPRPITAAATRTTAGTKPVTTTKPSSNGAAKTLVTKQTTSSVATKKPSPPAPRPSANTAATAATKTSNAPMKAPTKAPATKPVTPPKPATSVKAGQENGKKATELTKQKQNTEAKPTSVTATKKSPVNPPPKAPVDQQKTLSAPKPTEASKKTINSTLPAGIPTNIPPSRKKDEVSNSILEELVAVGSDVKPFIPGQELVSPVDCEPKKPEILTEKDKVLPDKKGDEVKHDQVVIKKEESSKHKDEVKNLNQEHVKEGKLSEKEEKSKSSAVKLEAEKPEIPLDNKHKEGTVDDLNVGNQVIKQENTPKLENKPEILNGFDKHNDHKLDILPPTMTNGFHHVSEIKEPSKVINGNEFDTTSDSLKPVDDLVVEKMNSSDLHSLPMDEPSPMLKEDISTSNLKQSEDKILDIPSVGEMIEIKLAQDDKKLDDLEDSIEENDDAIGENGSKITDSQLNDSLDGIDDESDQIQAITSTTNVSEVNQPPTQSDLGHTVFENQSKNPFMDNHELSSAPNDDLQELGIFEDKFSTQNGDSEHLNGIGKTLLGPIHVEAENFIGDEPSPSLNNPNTNGNTLDSPNSEASVNSVVMQPKGKINIGFENLNSGENKQPAPSSNDSTQMPTDATAFNNLMREKSAEEVASPSKGINGEAVPYPEKVDFFTKSNDDKAPSVQNSTKLDHQQSLGFEAFDEGAEPKNLPPPTNKGKQTLSVPSTGLRKASDTGSKTSNTSTGKGPSNTSLIGAAPAQLPTPLPAIIFLEVAWVPGYAAECPLTLITDYFKVVRAKIYILSGEALHPNIGEALLKAKPAWDEKMTEKWLDDQKIKILATDEPPNWIRWLRTPSKLSGKEENSSEDMITGEQRLIEAGFEVPPAANLCDIQLSSGEEKIVTPGCRFEL